MKKEEKRHGQADGGVEMRCMPNKASDFQIPSHSDTLHFFLEGYRPWQVNHTLKEVADRFVC